MTNKSILLIAALCFAALAQQGINLTGTVTNASNSQPLKGVVVTLKNTPALIDTTKADGTYQLSGTVGVTHNLSGVESFSGSRFTSGLLEISVTKQEPVAVETFGLNGVLKARLVHEMMQPGVYKFDVRGSSTNANLMLIKVRQGDKTTVYPYLPIRSSFTNSTPLNKVTASGLGKSLAFSDTLIFTMSGFTTARKAITAATGVNNIALTPASSGNTVTDIDGNVYHTVTIGTQVWMVENLKTTHYNDGSAITLDTNSSTWGHLTTEAYCWYNNDITNKTPYGALYNWYAVNTGKLAPTGWHVPSDTEWEVLGNYLGGDGDTAGGALKATGTTYWQSPNTGATNSTGFSALPGGGRFDSGPWYDIVDYGHWWSSTAHDATYSWYRSMNYNSATVVRHNGNSVSGFSVRCVKDTN